MGFVCLQLKQFHFLPPNRLAKRGGEDIQAQTCLFSSKRRGRAKGNPAYVLDEKHIFARSWSQFLLDLTVGICE